MKRIKSLLLVLLFTFSSICISAPISFTGTITSDVTLSVPSDFSDINAALDYLNNKSIAADVTVTIQVADGTYNNYDTIDMTHVDGDQIKILGNTIYPSNCTINFKTGVSGVTVTNGKTLSLIDGFKLVGTDSSGTYGLYSAYNSTMTAGSSMIIQDFSIGASATMNSMLALLSGLLTTSNTTYGVLATHQSTVSALGVTSSYNGLSGFDSGQSGYLNAAGSSSQNNGTYGYRALHGSYINGLNTSSGASGNPTNYSPGNTTGNFNSYVYWN